MAEQPRSKVTKDKKSENMRTLCSKRTDRQTGQDRTRQDTQDRQNRQNRQTDRRTDGWTYGQTDRGHDRTGQNRMGRPDRERERERQTRQTRLDRTDKQHLRTFGGGGGIDDGLHSDPRFPRASRKSAFGASCLYQNSAFWGEGVPPFHLSTCAQAITS